MPRVSVLALIALTTLAACGTPEVAAPVIGPDGRELSKVYPIAESDRDAIQIRFLDGMNTLRQARGVPPVALDPFLTAAAATHSRDMSVQNRPWHFGSDGSSPLDRVQRVGYTGRLLGENISETYETELETLAAWMEDAETRSVILDPLARTMGFAWFQEPNGKIWWTMVTGA
ncbi:CAP domain-containing protein [Palleronia sediminis]|uniref:CAP domain-containing protein n=1 Tax=Palleronia sediminis TaxID=2547833 RepID=A0A4R6AAN2_9RHOB|nr:CAP domain-containing protein [Palleronia sediminis]TDL78163.1 CAP domain-containing protein [Palleronia sediminis]